MLIMAILLSLVCPVVLLKYDLRKYVNTFMGRGQTSVGKYNPACGVFLSQELLIFEKSSHPDKASRLDEVLAKWCISLCKGKLFIWGCIHSTRAGSRFGVGGVSRGGVIFLRVSSFWRGRWALGYHSMEFRHFPNIS